MPRIAKERQKEWNAERNGTPEGPERRKERNAGRNGTPVGTIFFFIEATLTFHRSAFSFLLF